jgi:glycosyltransferase involved in cell wall biosynthesis
MSFSWRMDCNSTTLLTGETIMSELPQTIGVLIPTYKRSEELLRCLAALENQIHPADDVILVIREDDLDTRSALAARATEPLPIRIVTVTTPGLVAARNAGIDACTTDVLAMIDDDTSPHPHWLDRVLEDFQNDQQLGGLGGRDRCFDGEAFDERRMPVVGKLQWFGRVIGNHHLGFGDIREVDVLKGANMSYRAKALKGTRCDPRLKGSGAQPSEDISLCVAVKRNGWKLAYDPQALVDHYPGKRIEERHYGGVMPIKDAIAFQNFAYNEVLGIWGALTPLRRVFFFVWSILIGTGVCPGFVQAIRFTPPLGLQSWRRFLIAQRGKLHAFRDLTQRKDQLEIKVEQEHAHL